MRSSRRCSPFRVLHPTSSAKGVLRVAFETDLRILLGETSPEGKFAEQARAVELVVWQRK